MFTASSVIDGDSRPVHDMPSGLCEDVVGDAAALIARMAQGDGRALTETSGMWAPTLLGISLRMLQDRREADKALRDTFLRIWENSASYDPHQSPPFVWAFTILRDVCIERLRRRRRRTKKEVSLPGPAVVVNPQVMVAEDSRRLGAALESLAPDERVCLETAVFLGYARTPGSSEAPTAAVKSCLRRALDKIRLPLSRYEL